MSSPPYIDDYDIRIFPESFLYARRFLQFCKIYANAVYSFGKNTEKVDPFPTVELSFI